MVSSGVWARILRRSGRLLMAKPSLFPALSRVFSRFRRFFVSGSRRFLFRSGIA